MDLNKVTDQVKQKVDIEKIKANAEQAKSQIEHSGIADNPKAKIGIIAGGALLLLGVGWMLFGGSSNSSDMLAQSFPTDASTQEQCEFVGDYNYALYAASIEGMSADDIRDQMKNDIKDPSDMPKSAAKYFYSKKVSAFDNVDRLVKSANSAEVANASESEIQRQLEKKRSREVKRCLSKAL
ncbi:hypothetical protein [Vibrio intestinalis]|uniref:hypothetical protein n=1 Tax=Vibrio intestinalis TaxID=2933291 RepID=UPI0021A43888|nr:hypothetical protein [Vibrio intestinalis]